MAKAGIPLEVDGESFVLRNLLLDFNGTIALGGKLLPAVKPLLEELAALVDIVVLTADTFGSARNELAGVACEIRVVKGGEEKLEYLKSLGCHATAAIGNGNNDSLMLSGAKISVAVIGPEGAHRCAVAAAQISVGDVKDALAILLNSRRVTATLRP